MSMNSLKVFEFENKQVRVVTVDGEPWWIVKDVCDVLGLNNTTEALRPLDDSEKGSFRISEGTSPKGGNPNVAIINESGLYMLIMRSSKPEAKRFRRWVTAEVLPAIRKHGAYMTPEKLEEVLYNPDLLIGLAERLKYEQQRVDILRSKVEDDRPKVLFADSVTASRTSILIGELAKLLRQNGVEVGQNRLFELLRNEGYLFKNGSSRNMPTQRAIELQLFEIKETTINRSDGGIDVKKTPKVTGRGQVYFVNKFCGNKVISTDAVLETTAMTNVEGTNNE